MTFNRRWLIRCFLFMVGTAFCFKSSVTPVLSQPVNRNPMIITVDARTPWKPRIPVHVKLRAAPGPLKLAFPRWLPGMHAAEGPLGNFARIKLSANRLPIQWNRDPFDPYTIQTVVPQNCPFIEADYEYVSTNGASEIFFGVGSSQELAVINPAAFSLAPQADPHNLQVQLILSLPKDWVQSSALTPLNSLLNTRSTEANVVNYATVSLYTLIDSPIMAGRHHKTISLPTSAHDVPHTLDLYAESDDVLAKKAAVVTPLMSRLVLESGKMFGVRHYNSFHYLLGLSAEIGRNGLEHHASVAYVLQPDDLDDAKKQLPESAWNALLIPHEFAHSWNGKYRRPYGENSKTNVSQQSADLIWVYEGLTQYLGDVLMVRSGFRSADAWKNDLLLRLATSRFGNGRDWESIADAAMAAPFTYIHGSGTSLRSVNDIYYEGEMVWLEADATIRKLSKGTKSLDDFCRIFFGGINRGPEIIPYTRKDVVDALRKTIPYDWAGFVQKRFYDPPKGLPSEAFAQAGWKFEYAATPSVAVPGMPDYRYSLGARVLATGQIMEVVPGSVAEKSGLESKTTIMGADGLVFSPAALQEAIKATAGGKKSMELLIAQFGKYKTIKIEGLDGEKYPSLKRITDQPDYFADVTTPAFPPPKPPATK